MGIPAMYSSLYWNAHIMHVGTSKGPKHPGLLGFQVPHIGMLGDSDPTWHSGLLYFGVDLIGPLQKPNIGVEYPCSTLDGLHDETLEIHVEASFGDTNELLLLFSSRIFVAFGGQTLGEVLGHIP